MLFTKSIALAALAAANTASAGQTIKVQVGNGGKQFNPNNIQAKVGDFVEFTFFPQNHTVTQSSFKDVCQPLANGFNSDFTPTKDGPSPKTFTIEVKDTKPIWFYCAQGDHCKSGMVGAVNAAPTGNATFEIFLENAKKFTGTTKPGAPGPVGGVNPPAAGSSTSVGKPYTTSKPASTYTKTWTYTTKSADKTVTVTTSAVTTEPAQVVTVTPGAPQATDAGSQGGNAGQAASSSSVPKGAGAAVTAPAMLAMNAGVAVLAAAAFL